MMELSPTEVLDVKILFKREDKKIQLRESLLKNTFFSRFQKNKVYKLADECFTNEFIWDETEEEKQLVQKLIEDVKNDTFKDPKEGAHAVALIACYQPLYKTDAADNALKYAEKIDNSDYTELVKYAVKEPREEEEIKKDLKTFGSFKDKVTKKVKQQYEENPYPRWRNVEYRSDTINKQEDVKIEILIAGCGTGLQVINISKEYPNSNITAFDLSTSSLAYGMRNARAQGVSNVDFYCGDLLEVRELGKKFDYIVVTGVLNCLDDPLKGWQGLVDVLEPGGGMTVSLYSELARYPVNLGRKYIADNNLEFNMENLRKFRNHLKTELPKENPLVRLALWGDFYSASEIRDMVFHVQELQFTIPQIKEYLDKVGLEFNGFIPKDKRLDDFLTKHPSDEDRKDLDLWHDYEVKNPMAFTGMYQIACLKPAKEKAKKAA